MSRRLVALVSAACLLLLGLGSAIAIGHGGGDRHNRGLFADLNGKNEISATTGERGAGDPDGFGSATFTFDGDQVCFGITVANIGTPVMAHIHEGRKHENGPVVVPLTQPATGDPGASSGCVAIEPALAAKIKADPRGFYANVHTGDFAAGAVRGQLKPLRHGHH